MAAETEGQAREALAAIEVEYEVLPFVVDAAAALQPDAPAVQEAYGNRVGPPSIYDRGDLTQGFAEADTVLEQTYRTSCEVHTPLEVHGSVARWERGHLTVWDTTQGVFGVRDELARALGLPLSRVRVVSPYMGGGFGSKLEAGKYTVIAALLARQSERPVRLFLNREEGFLCVGNRPPNVITLKASAKKDGALTALQLGSLGAATRALPVPTWARWSPTCTAVPTSAWRRPPSSSMRAGRAPCGRRVIRKGPGRLSR